MIVNDGKVKLLNSQLTYLSGLYWCLFTSNTTISDTTVWSDLTEAAWSGYARVLSGTWQTPTISANKAITQPNAYPAFGNSSGGSQTFYGWALYDASAGKLVAAVNLGSQTIASAGTYPLVPFMSDNDVAG